jgi:hypothetical protein
MTYAVIRAAGADIGMLVRGAIFDRVVITVEEEEGRIRITYDDGVETYEPHDLLHVQVEPPHPR